jgi:hypothetical protein
VGDIEEARGLIQEEDPGLLGEGKGDPRALALTAGERTKRAAGEAAKVGRGEGELDRLDIGLCRAL